MLGWVLFPDFIPWLRNHFVSVVLREQGQHKPVPDAGGALVPVKLLLIVLKSI